MFGLDHLKEYLDDLNHRQDLKTFRIEVAKHTVQSQAQQKQWYDQKHCKLIKYHVGDMVQDP